MKLASWSVGLLLACAGCNRDPSAGGANAGGGGGNGVSSGKPGAGTIAFVDLDRISRTIGWWDEKDRATEATKADLTRTLQSYLKTVDAALEAKRDSIARSAHLNSSQVDQLKNIKTDQDLEKLLPSREQRDDYKVSLYLASQEYQKANQALTQAMQARTEQLINAYRVAMQPTVRRVASSNGVTAVMTLGPQMPLLWLDSSADLTDKVIDEMQRAMPQHTLPDPPKINTEPFHFPPTTAPAATPAPAPTPSTHPF